MYTHEAVVFNVRGGDFPEHFLEKQRIEARAQDGLSEIPKI